MKQSSGLPVAKPTPLWSIPASPIQKESSSAALPANGYAVFIGSGITGKVFSRTLIEVDRLEVVMLEARDACSGRGQLYHDYLNLKTKHGAEAAKQIIELTEERQCCKVDTYDVFFDKTCLREPRRSWAATWRSR